MTNTNREGKQMAAIVTGFEYVSMDEVTEAVKRQAIKDGTAAGSWVFDGNTSESSYADALRMDEEGDPEFDDRYGARNPFSGEFADDKSIKEVLDDLGYVPDTFTEAEIDELMDAYEQPYFDAHRDEVLRVARAQMD